MRYALFADRVLTPQGIVEKSVVTIADGKIEHVSQNIPTNCEVIRLEHSILMPGFIDLHMHGRAGSDVMDGTIKALQTIASALPETGVVAWVGTTVTAPMNDILCALKNIREFIEMPQQIGAELLGSFLEGPYFSEAHRGSHPTNYLISPSIDHLEDILDHAANTLLRVAIAPEIEGAMKAFDWLAEHKIKTSVAHTDASFEKVTEAFQHGADCGVHLFNGMRGLHHREPGCCGAILYHNMLAELIADGVHVHPAMMQLSYRMAGYQGIALITDCMRAGGLSDGKYQLGIQTVNVINGQARTVEGSLAGSTCSMDLAIRNMVQFAGVPLWEAVQMATFVPAHYLNLSHRLGSIQAGMDASLTVMDDNLHIQDTIIKGEWVFTNNVNRHTCIYQNILI
ncbi:N-acetylglucosamine-6-phosphate deacetylase [Jinshanibacter sp. LJY008]|uniref:N-acetylglucosamine-6-phosphate deacetylase n=1 Tax=Limnobaculum eriocheiris TaxID=2897391 RepID=A0A9X1SNR5_9GAMM|nr:N-acetylglucosamine-6-phosphate deacetylase [Limnobaculum eriocheiris]MCD1125332.1 N-acetylglucosamine-6-phosphate deacetylase [Limnobaculum eriocheiris]